MIKFKKVEIAKEVIACDVSHVAMFIIRDVSLDHGFVKKKK